MAKDRMSPWAAVQCHSRALVFETINGAPGVGSNNDSLEDAKRLVLHPEPPSKGAVLSTAQSFHHFSPRWLLPGYWFGFFSWLDFKLLKSNQVRVGLGLRAELSEFNWLWDAPAEKGGRQGSSRMLTRWWSCNEAGRHVASRVLPNGILLLKWSQKSRREPFKLCFHAWKWQRATTNTCLWIGVESGRMCSSEYVGKWPSCLTHLFSFLSCRLLCL